MYETFIDDIMLLATRNDIEIIDNSKPDPITTSIDFIETYKTDHSDIINEYLVNSELKRKSFWLKDSSDSPDYELWTGTFPTSILNPLIT